MFLNSVTDVLIERANFDCMKNLIRTLCFFALVSAQAQTQTVGTLLNTANAFDGYTLFAPMTSNTTYLIDNCGQQINSWESTVGPGLSAYLLENGNLLRSKNMDNQTFTSGGSGGGAEMFDWDGNLLWSYTISSSTECQHHDIEYLPNGNVLMIVWESVSSSEAIQQGRNPSNAPNTLWPDKIVEVEPSGTTGGNIVWEWHAWDHLIQDYDNTKDNYGVVADHPELIDLNYPNNGNTDWLHLNAVDYNPEFDQIIISSHNTNEVWIIDHSTTTQEAASHSGGTYGKGGDLLYRWGNPQAYDRGNPSTKKLYGQHDARWVTEGSDAGKIMVFNNGQNRSPGVSYSSVDMIDPPVDAFGNYTQPSSGQSFMPSSLYWTYFADPTSDFYSGNISGAHRLSNDNTIICEGSKGRFFEVDQNGETVWEYKAPISINGPVDQGTTIVGGNSVFRCTRYAPDYAAFDGKDMTPGDVIELNSNFTCELFPSTTTAITHSEEQEMQVIMNQSAGYLSITDMPNRCLLRVFDSFGRIVVEKTSNSGRETLSTSYWPSGIYHVVVYTTENISSKKVLVL